MGKFYLLIFLPADNKKFAIIASKKVGKAVKRNYEKRVMRLLIKEFLDFIPSLHFLLICLQNREGSFQDKKEDLKNIFYKLKKRIEN